MTAYTKWMVALVVIMLGITGAVIWTIQDRFFKPEPLTIREATVKIESLYGGTVEAFEQRDNQFYLELERDGITYDIQINADTGDISTFSQVDSKKVQEEETIVVKTIEEIRTILMDQKIGTIQSITLRGKDRASQYVVKASLNQEQKTIVVNAITGEIISEEVTNSNTASPTTPTIITKNRAQQIALSQLKGEVEYVVYEKTSDGGYYLVEIEGTNKEAVFQIHAISGRVLSVTQSDHNKISDDTDDDFDDSEKNDDDTDEEDDDSESDDDNDNND